MTEMTGWHHRLNGLEIEQTLGDGGGQGSLVCCSPWDCKESDMTWQPNSNPIPSVSASYNGTPKSLVTSCLLQTLGHLLCCSYCQYGDSNQSPLGPWDPRPKAMAMVSHSTMDSTFG